MLTRRIVFALAAAVMLCGVGASLHAAQKKVSVTVINHSLWEIHEFYLSTVDDNDWGPDQLEDEIIEAEGGEFKLTGIPVGRYDVKLVDEDADECVVEDVAIGIDGSETWEITSKDLLKCQG
ncbi:MAG: hypothetical protein AB7V01_05740 [Vicinamibacterales bacterium]